jgi:transcriptional regulator with XRE-family HTH domain
VQLGQHSRVTYKFIGEMERGTANPSLVTMVLVANALGCTVTDLLHDDKSAAYVMLPADDARRVHEAAAVIASIMMRPKQSRRGR